MAIVYTDSANYSDIADAIRSKNGTQNTYKPEDMAAAINAIPADPPTGTISITADGTYDVSTFATANVNTKPTKGLVFGDYDADGYPHTAEFVGSWTSIPGYYCQGVFGGGDRMSTQINSKIVSIRIPNGVTQIYAAAFDNCGTLQEITFPPTLLNMVTSSFRDCRALLEVNLPNKTNFGYGAGAANVFQRCTALKRVYLKKGSNGIPNNCFASCTNIELYDFSEADEIIPLASVASLGHASGCVIKVPQSLLTDWQNETNWIGLTDVVWQGV